MIRLLLPVWRRGLQIGLALLMAVVPLANARGINIISGNYLAVEILGVPLGDPLAAFQVLVSARGIAWTGAVGAGLALILALVLGPVFCAYACPYGLFSEWAHRLARRLGRVRPGRFPGQGFAVKAGLAAIGSAVIGLFGLPPLLNLLSMPASYSRVWQYAVLGGFWFPVAAMPIMLVIEAWTGIRLWCRFVCPQSALLALVHRLAPWGLRVGFDPKRCTCSGTDQRCVASCHLGLDPRRGKTLPLVCTNCGDCVAACRRAGQALGFQLGATPEKGTRKTDSTTVESRL
ncbi:4Fe-4S binding protein [Solidesulfovibrio sp. C21]|uniref:4Fe-4S binding protein n=1 Tax=Solidesulfovibrio sp. C21 TaxID=3398613 RepID=UPI0039FD29EC